MSEEQIDELQGLEGLKIDSPEFMDISEDTPIIGRASGNSFAYYKIHVSDVTKMLTVM